MTEYDNISIVPSFSDQEDESYIARASEVAKLVIASYLSEQIRKEKIEENKIGAFSATRLPICVDALRRGEPIVRQQLQAGLDIDEGEGIRTFRMDENGRVSWRLSPKQSDIFAQGKFYSTLRESGQPTEGTSEFWTDQYLVDESLQTGLKEQDKIFADYISAASSFDMVQRHCLYTLAIIKSPTYLEYTEEVSAVRNSIAEASSRDEQRLNFASNFLVPQDPVVESFSKARDFFQSILRLNDLFQSEGKSVPDSYKSRYEASLVAELLTNPHAPVSPGWLRTPKTTVEHVSEANSFINQLVAETTSEDLPMRLFMIVDLIIKEQGEKLKDVFVSLGIDPELGLEYAARLMSTHLRDLPGREYKDINSHPELNNIYLFEVEIPHRKRGIPPKREPKAPSLEDFMNNVIKEGRLAPQILSRIRLMNETSQRQALTALLDQGRYEDEREYKEAIVKILTDLGIVFSSERKQFVGALVKPPIDSSTFLLHLLIQKINEGDSVSIDILEAVMVKTFFNRYLEQRSIEVRDLRNLLGMVSATTRRLFEAEYDDIANTIARIERLTIGAILSEFDPVKNDIQVLERKIKAVQIMYGRVITERGKTLNFGRRQATAGEVQLLSELSSRLASINISGLVYGTISQIKEDYFGEGYNVDKANYIAKILEESLVNFGDSGKS